MMEQLLLKLASIQKKYSVPIIILALFFSLFFSYYAYQLETDASFDGMYRADSDTTTLKNLVASEFGSTETLFILITVDQGYVSKNGIDDIRDPRVLSAVGELVQTLKDEESIHSTHSIVDAITATGSSLPITMDQSKEVISDILQSNKFLINNDYSALNLILSVNIPNKIGSIEKIEDRINEILDSSNKPIGIKYVLTGQPTMLNRIMNLLISDNLITIAFALLCISVLLFFFFKSIRISIVAVIPVVVTLALLAGTLKLLDIKVNMMIAAVGAMLVGMGIDYSIHITHSYHELIKKGEKNPLSKVVSSTGGALFTSALTTLAGFVAMVFGITPSSKIQGTVLAIGIFYAFISTIILLPCLLEIQKKKLYSPLDHLMFKLVDTKKSKLDFVKQYLSKLAYFQVKHPLMVLGAVFIVTLLLTPGASLVYMDTDNGNWIPDGDEVVESLNLIKSEFGGTEQFNLLVSIDSDYFNSINDIRDSNVLNKIKQLDNTLEQLSYITRVSSVTDLIPNNKFNKDASLEGNKLELSRIPRSNSFFNDDYSITKMTILSDNFGTPGTNEQDINFNEIVGEIESIQFPDGIKVIPQGGIVSFIELRSELSRDTAFTAMLGLLFVVLIASFVYRSFVSGILAFLPIIFAIIWTICIMGYLNLPFTVLTSGMLAIVMGIGIDFSIHIIHNTKLNERSMGFDSAISNSIVDTGEAMFYASATTILGFLSLVLASLLITQRLGFTLAIAIFASFFSCILIVPAVLKIQNKFKSEVKQ